MARRRSNIFPAANFFFVAIDLKQLSRLICSVVVDELESTHFAAGRRSLLWLLRPFFYDTHVQMKLAVIPENDIFANRCVKLGRITPFFQHTCARVLHFPVLAENTAKALIYRTL